MFLKLLVYNVYSLFSVQFPIHPVALFTSKFYSLIMFRFYYPKRVIKACYIPVPLSARGSEMNRTVQIVLEGLSV